MISFPGMEHQYFRAPKTSEEVAAIDFLTGCPGGFVVAASFFRCPHPFSGVPLWRSERQFFAGGGGIMKSVGEAMELDT